MISSNKWGLNRKTFKQVASLHNKKFDVPHKIDAPEHCMLGADYWNEYSVKDYNYEYNSWGFRGQDYEQHIGKLVNICIGDSNGVNIGGPMEHSWAFQLSQKFDIPTLNYAIDGLCFYDFGMLLDKAKTFFKINKVFVQYNFFDNQERQGTHSVIPIYNNSNINSKIDVLKKYCWIQGAYWQFDPPWTFIDDELALLYEHFPDAHNYLNNFKLDWKQIDYRAALSSNVLATEYQKIAGTDWISYAKFIELLVVDPEFLMNQFSNSDDVRLIKEYLNIHVSKLLLTNRDGWHMSQQLNQSLADYFYQQATKTH